MNPHTEATRPDDLSALHHFRDLFDQMQAGMCVMQEGRPVLANRCLAGMLDASGAWITTLAPLLARPQLWPMLSGIGRGRRTVRCVRSDGSEFEGRASAQPVQINGRPAEFVTVVGAAEMRHMARASDWRARMLAQTESLCHSGSVEIDLLRRRLTPSAGLCALLGLSDEPGPVSLRQALRWLPRDERRHVLSIWRAALVGEPLEFQHRIERADGTRLVVLQRGLIEESDDEPLRATLLLQDVTAQREAERRVDELAHFDEVTGLPNRSSLLDRIDAAIHLARWNEQQFALLSVQVDQVDRIKETLGYGAGDALAMALAARLSGVVNEDELLAHLGGGEFALLLGAHTGLVETAVLARAREIADTLQRPEHIGGTELVPAGRIGVAGFPHDAQTPQQLLERAQTASLAAQDADLQIAFFTPDTNRHAVRRIALEAGLRRAVERGELSLRYQPQASLHDGQVAGAEALLRWNSAELGMVSPVEFIPVAEETGLIVPIGDWVLREACRQIKVWEAAGLNPQRIAVNLSQRQLQLADIVQRVHAALLDTGVDPGLLALEITESMLASDLPHATRTLKALQAIGIEIALDDFGTGYSNLSVLRTLPIDVLKVDRSCIQDVTAAPEDVSVTRAIITMAHGLQMKVLAEGVETEGQLSLLIANGCDYMQGYYFAKPLLPQEYAALLVAGQRLPERFFERGQRRRTLLLVDDEANVLTALKRMFRRDGYLIVSATSGAEGLQRLAEHEVDVIVSDQRMPGMTGVEFLRRAKTLYPNTVRMVLSGYTELQSITDAINEGAIYKFLTKPWDDERLRAHVEEAFRHKDLGDENRRLAGEVRSAHDALARVNERLEALLASQRERLGVEESRAVNAREVLDQVPASIIGIDDEGLIAFINRDAQSLLPEAFDMIGNEAADALPRELMALWRADDDSDRWMEFRGRRYRAVCRPIASHNASGRLLVLTPAELHEQGAAA